MYFRVQNISNNVFKKLYLKQSFTVVLGEKTMNPSANIKDSPKIAEVLLNNYGE